DYSCGDYAYLVESADGSRVAIVKYSGRLGEVRRALLIGNSSADARDQVDSVECQKSVRFSSAIRDFFESGFYHAREIDDVDISGLPDHVRNRIEKIAREGSAAESVNQGVNEGANDGVNQGVNEGVINERLYMAQSADRAVLVALPLQ